jgi:lipopolysaccharide transport system permease protein
MDEYARMRRFTMLSPRFRRDIRLAVQDLRDGALSIHIWPLLAWQEVKTRYRRSLLGPLWLTISTAIMVGAMGPLYGRLFNQPLTEYFAYLAVSLVVWQLISNLLIEAGHVFISSEGFIKQVKLPYTLYIVRLVWRHLIIFGHNVIIILAVLAFYRTSWDWRMMITPISIVLVAINGIWLALLLGMLCARFRDIPPVVSSLVQIALFVSPIMWKPQMLGKYEWTVLWNPLFHFIEIVRAPLLGSPIPNSTWAAIALITLGGYAVTLLFFARFRARIPYWI